MKKYWNDFSSSIMYEVLQVIKIQIQIKKYWNDFSSSRVYEVLQVRHREHLIAVQVRRILL